MKVDETTVFIETRQRKVGPLVVTAGTNCPDYSGSGRTHLSLRNAGGADLRAKANERDLGYADRIAITLEGDTEHGAFIEALQSAMRDGTGRLHDEAGCLNITAGMRGDLAYLRIENPLGLRIGIEFDGRDIGPVKSFEIGLNCNAPRETMTGVLEFAIPILSSCEGPTVAVN